jgi:hypothetical protein
VGIFLSALFKFRRRERAFQDLKGKGPFQEIGGPGNSNKAIETATGKTVEGRWENGRFTKKIKMLK